MTYWIQAGCFRTCTNEMSTKPLVLVEQVSVVGLNGAGPESASYRVIRFLFNIHRYQGFTTTPKYWKCSLYRLCPGCLLSRLFENIDDDDVCSRRSWLPLEAMFHISHKAERQRHASSTKYKAEGVNSSRNHNKLASTQRRL